MIILVTGCAGFIGFHTVKALTGNGHNVIGVDNLNEYYDVNLKMGRLKELENCENFTFVKADICDGEKMETLFVNYRFDRVCHLAAQAGVRYSFENPKAYIDSNIKGFENVIELCRKYSVPHFVYASSSSVYGKNTKIPFSENDELLGQVSLYAETKRQNELEAMRYYKEFGIRCTGLRFFTVYGPWGRPDMAPVIFMDAISKGTPIRVFNNGQMWRDFTYIDDIIEGVIKVLEAAVNNAPSYKIYNLGNGNPVYLPDFINILEDVVGKKAVKIMEPMQKGDVVRTFADISLIEKDFGYKPKSDIKKGITELWNWYKVFLKKI